jgi:hypothetical protein
VASGILGAVLASCASTPCTALVQPAEIVIGSPPVVDAGDGVCAMVPEAKACRSENFQSSQTRAMAFPPLRRPYVAWGPAGPSPDDEEVGGLWGVIREPVRMADKHHVTGKPTAVMQRLVRICPPGGVVLDPFAGSSTTGVAALLEGRRFAGIERVAEYVAIGRDRLEAAEVNVNLEAHRGAQEPLFELTNVTGCALGAERRPRAQRLRPP